MPMSAQRWKVVTPSEFAWEREALEFTRERLPDRDPYYAWSNFEFIADNGTISEVDLLVLSPEGFFLVEIKSRPGVISGNGLTWTWTYNGKTYVDDSPMLSANRKAKKLAALLKSQRATQNIKMPFLTPLIFCSHPENQNQLQGSARYGICLRDKEASHNRPARKGIVSALTKRDYEGASEHPRSSVDRPTARAIIRAMEQAGIQSSQRSRRVGDHLLGKLLYESSTGLYQDWEATHTVVKSSAKRVRIYNLSRTASEEERDAIRRAAKREYQFLDALDHKGILRAEFYTEHELGPALIFRHDAEAIRLDHFLTKHAARLNVDMRLNLLRQIAEAIKYAHEKKIVHRALSPQSILVFDPESAYPQTKIVNWQIGFRSSTTSTKSSTGLGATMHPENLVEDAATVYLAPESLTDTEALGEHLDIFSLGAIAFHLFSGQPPAFNALDLMQKIRDGKGLQISSVIDGAGTQLQELIQFSTHPEVALRWDTVSDFLDQLEKVEDELTTPDADRGVLSNPLEAKGSDRLQGGFLVKNRLGSGSSAIAFLVEKDGKEVVLKLANSPDHNDRLRAEYETLKKLRHPNIVEADDLIEIGGLIGFTMQRATEQKTHEGSQYRYLEGTLAHRLKVEGRLHMELLQRFGEDLLDAVKYLEQFGVNHRDIKPDNIGIRHMGRGDMLRLLLFDFSLSRTSVDNIRAGTAAYLDPFIFLRKPPRWDLYAERFAVAVTLYEMATGTLPKWGDGQSSPEVLDCEATLRPELFDPSLREDMADFFTKALRRDYRKRFDNADEMLTAWKDIFRAVDQPVSGTVSSEDFNQDKAIENATLSTQVITLGLSTRAANAIDRLNAITVADFLTIPLRRIYRLPGVGSKTRNEVRKLVQVLRQRFPDADLRKPDQSRQTSANSAAEAAVASIDLIAHQVSNFGSQERESKERKILQAFLGWDAVSTPKPVEWASQIDLAQMLGLTRQRISQIVTKARERWRKNPSVTSLRNTIAEFVKSSGGAMTVAELGDAVLAARGSGEEEPLRSQYAAIATRAAVEAESVSEKPRFIERRMGQSLIITVGPEIADYVERLGRAADKLAAADPLPTPQRVLESLREVAGGPEDAPFIPDSQLVKLAVTASQAAALSSRMEIYPRGMDALRALQLAHGALLGARELTVSEIQNRVQGRYPEARELPPRPRLDQLLAETGLELVWNPVSAEGKGAYKFKESEAVSGLSSSTMHSRMATLPPPTNPPAVQVSPEVAEAKVFENKLRRADQEGAFLVLSVPRDRLLEAERELLRRFDVERRNMDELLIRAMREQAERAKVDWGVVLKADAAARDSVDWRNLMILVGRSIPPVEERLAVSDKTILLTYPGLLARYERLDLLEKLRDKIGTATSRLHGLWVLLPSDERSALPMLNGKAVPIIGSGQWAQIPEVWIYNQHRAENGNGNLQSK